MAEQEGPHQGLACVRGAGPGVIQGPYPSYFPLPESRRRWKSQSCGCDPQIKLEAPRPTPQPSQLVPAFALCSSEQFLLESSAPPLNVGHHQHLLFQFHLDTQRHGWGGHDHGQPPLPGQAVDVAGQDEAAVGGPSPPLPSPPGPPQLPSEFLVPRRSCWLSKQLFGGR